MYENEYIKQMHFVKNKMIMQHISQVQLPDLKNQFLGCFPTCLSVCKCRS